MRLDPMQAGLLALAMVCGTVLTALGHGEIVLAVAGASGVAGAGRAARRRNVRRRP